jgi:RNA 2',3'-cyclic 3'-phosphodiesterase
MFRLFVAVRPPRAVRDALFDLMDGVRNARWQDDEQLHLTLRFIGGVDRHCAADVAAALGTIHHPSFDLALKGVGSFSRRGRAHALWAGVALDEELRSLQKKIERALQSAGLSPEHRAFHPHVTLARLSGSAGAIDEFIAVNSGFASKPFPVANFHLFESELSAQGASYSIVETYRLG